ncbi:hypothetical protein TWF106_004341 [Orbilia oligospora]|uniref:Uncharacterized protein n=1 Tax=Orbilia oligospora TaxID=2813651 RepID=A0A6G1MPL9_ORBOL|nr:hypothetical protein TWF788_003304 [Orbilia oligospora]KAF3209485.1 hypothetical protein TWF679_007310 [Orbilia oligospora]KAF3216236.1 hypothetical protein TWF191_009065 [Orbilia oligospora]KAF3229424.1 hypothetical protein TWF106_004341 [Orbilia oligospora]KAF3264456.1 hypothetical protein TWF192_004138 [Orbilia oligospora]
MSSAEYKQRSWYIRWSVVEGGLASRYTTQPAASMLPLGSGLVPCARTKPDGYGACYISGDAVKRILGIGPNSILLLSCPLLIGYRVSYSLKFPPRGPLRPQLHP